MKSIQGLLFYSNNLNNKHGNCLSTCACTRVAKPYVNHWLPTNLWTIKTKQKPYNNKLLTWNVQSFWKTLTLPYWATHSSCRFMLQESFSMIGLLTQCCNLCRVWLPGGKGLRSLTLAVWLTTVKKLVNGLYSYCMFKIEKQRLNFNFFSIQVRSHGV